MWLSIIGVTTAVSFVVFFSLGVMLTMSIGCVLKTKTKVAIHQPTLELSAYDTIDTDQKKIKHDVEVKTNSAYGIVK